MSWASRACHLSQEVEGVCAPKSLGNYGLCCNIPSFQILNNILSAAVTISLNLSFFYDVVKVWQLFYFKHFLSSVLFYVLACMSLSPPNLCHRNHGSGQHAAQPILYLHPHVGPRGSTRPTQEEAHQHRDQRASGFRAQLQHGGSHFGKTAHVGLHSSYQNVFWISS